MARTAAVSLFDLRDWRIMRGIAAMKPRERETF